MASWVIALFFAIGACAWLYTYLMRNTGNNSKTVYTVLAGAFVVLFLFGWLVVDYIFGLGN
ncbi:MAG: hypothetical protein QG647_222 [Patescibacteria group bacterium]|nr:hypothetical protein [Patescibacteria group bacterium]